MYKLFQEDRALSDVELVNPIFPRHVVSVHPEEDSPVRRVIRMVLDKIVITPKLSFIDSIPSIAAAFVAYTPVYLEREKTNQTMQAIQAKSNNASHTSRHERK